MKLTFFTLLLCLVAQSPAFASTRKIDTCMVLDENKMVEFEFHPKSRTLVFVLFNENFQSIFRVEKEISQNDRIVTNRSTGSITSIKLDLGRTGSVEADLRLGTLKANIFMKLAGEFDIRCRNQKALISDNSGMAR